jgi:hypothetical protein
VTILKEQETHMKNIILDSQTIEVIVRDIEKPENITRKRRAWNSELIRTGKLRPFVEARIKEMYPKTHQMYSISDYSVLAKVVSKKAKAYKESPIRRITWKEGSSDIYNEICKRYNLNQAMNQLDIIYNEHKYGMIACMMDREVAPSSTAKSFWKFYALAPYEFDVIKNDDGEVKCVILSYPPSSVTSGSGSDGHDAKIAESGKADEGSDVRTYSLWTETEHKIIKVTSSRDSKKNIIEHIPLNGNPNGVNPYGVLPFVYVPMDYDANFPNPSPLPLQTVEFNALMSVYLTSANMQVGILKITRPEKQKINIASQSLYTAIEVPQSSRPEDKPSDIDFISPNPNMSGHREAIVTYLTAILDEQGISGSQVIKADQSFSSGFDRLLAQADVQAIIEENQEMYSRVEDRIFNVVAKQLMNVNGDNSLMVKEHEGSFVITYRKPRVLLSDNEKLTNLKLMKDLSLWSDAELIQMYDPNLSYDEAKEKLVQIYNDKVEMSSMFSDPDKVFNGAQVGAIVDVATKAGSGELTFDSAVNILMTSFGIAEETAKLLVPKTGSTAKVEE